MIEPRMGDAFDGTAAEWELYLEQWRREHAPAPPSSPRNPKLGPERAESDPYEIEDVP